MPAKKLLRLISGVVTEVVGIVTSGGATNDGDIPALDANGRLDISMMPSGTAAEIVVCPASETLVAGDMINLYNNAGALNARKADGSAAGKPADGFVIAGFASAASATVYFTSQTVTGKTGLTIGADYWLDVTTPGAITATAPTGAGKVSQYVGKALSATTLIFTPRYPVTLA